MTAFQIFYLFIPTDFELELILGKTGVRVGVGLGLEKDGVGVGVA